MTREQKQCVALANSVIVIANKFINKVESGRARSKETYADMLSLRAEVYQLKRAIEPKEYEKRS
jgi:hypothetical protein